MHKLLREFISNEKHIYRYQVGRLLASALSGFLAGVVFASIFWLFILYWYELLY